MANLVRYNSLNEPFEYNPFEQMQGMLLRMRRLQQLAQKQLTASPAYRLQLADDLAQSPAWSAQFNRLFGDNLAVDMRETDHEVIITAAVPGAAPDQIMVEEQDGWLSIRVEQKHEDQQSHLNWRLQERFYGTWQRTLRLPAEVNVDKAKTVLEQGVLTITLPKREAQKSLIQRIHLPKLKLPKLGKREPEVKVHSNQHS